MLLSSIRETVLDGEGLIKGHVLRCRKDRGILSLRVEILQVERCSDSDRGSKIEPTSPQAKT